MLFSPHSSNHSWYIQNIYIFKLKNFEKSEAIYKIFPFKQRIKSIWWSFLGKKHRTVKIIKSNCESAVWTCGKWLISDQIRGKGRKKWHRRKKQGSCEENEYGWSGEKRDDPQIRGRKTHTGGNGAISRDEEPNITRYHGREPGSCCAR